NPVATPAPAGPRVTSRPLTSATRPTPKPKASSPANKVYRPSIYPLTGPPLPLDFVTAVRRLEADLKMPVWLMVLGGREDEIDAALVNAFIANRHDLPKQPLALLLHSFGGQAISAFQ